MEFQWDNSPCPLDHISASEIEEAFEDPFSLRLMPETEAPATRYFCLGQSVAKRSLFIVFWTNGKINRVLCAREMTAEEEAFYLRQTTAMIS